MHSEEITRQRSRSRAIVMHEVMSGPQLAAWILTNSPPMTHLKLQKLCFYAYGALCAFELDSEVGLIEFSAWKHGPVSPVVYEKYAPFVREELEAQDAPSHLSKEAEELLRDVLEVYGPLSAWELRHQSHLEGPWIDTAQPEVIPTELIRSHFRKVHREPGPAPVYATWGALHSIDGLPVVTYDGIRELAEGLREARSLADL